MQLRKKNNKNKQLNTI